MRFIYIVQFTVKAVTKKQSSSDDSTSVEEESTAAQKFAQKRKHSDAEFEPPNVRLNFFIYLLFLIINFLEVIFFILLFPLQYLSYCPYITIAGSGTKSFKRTYFFRY